MPMPSPGNFSCQDKCVRKLKFAHEGYSLQDRDTGDVKKYGETTRGEDKFGAGNQKRYGKQYLKDNNVDYVKEASGTKKEMHDWQHEKIIEHKERRGQRPDLNKSDY